MSSIFYAGKRIATTTRFLNGARRNIASSPKSSAKDTSLVKPAIPAPVGPATRRLLGDAMIEYSERDDMPDSKYVPSDNLRKMVVDTLSGRFAEEVPAYRKFKELAHKLNLEYIEQHPEQASSLTRVVEEKHGAVRVGNAKELRLVQKILEICGLVATDTYDMTNADGNPIPVIGTAFIPKTVEELGKCAFRMFCSLLDSNNQNFFTEQQSKKINTILDKRDIGSDELRELFTIHDDQGGFTKEQADKFVTEAAKVFEMNQSQVVDLDTYFELRAVNPIAADIVCFEKPHLNHLTPRVYDIRRVHGELNEQGMSTIDRVQGPPTNDGVLVLLNQTSIRAPGEGVLMTDDAELRKKISQDPSLLDSCEVISLPREEGEEDPSYYKRLKQALKENKGALVEVVHKARFGEIEARGVALTEQGEQLYTDIRAEAFARVSEDDSLKSDKQKMVSFLDVVWPEIYNEMMPKTHEDLYQKDLAFYEVKATEEGLKANKLDLQSKTTKELVASGYAEIIPITYEVFLRESASNIFRSNVDKDGEAKSDKYVYDQDAKHAEALGKKPLSHIEMYKLIAQQSEKKLLEELGISSPERSK